MTALFIRIKGVLGTWAALGGSSIATVVRKNDRLRVT